MRIAERCRILVVEGNARETNERIVALGGRPYAESYAALLQRLSDRIVCTIIRPSDDGVDGLLPAQAAEHYAGAVWTGSALHVYDSSPAVTNQLRLAERVIDAGIPVFGSCWGLQVFTSVLGGSVQANPRGREIGIAHNILMTEAGAGHPMYAGKPRAFDALAVHVDEVQSLPASAQLLAGNDVSQVQALAIEEGGWHFWGVQYHPEFDFFTMGLVIRRLAPALVQEGFFDDETAAHDYAQRLAVLGDGPIPAGLAWQYGLTAAVREPALRQREITNWLSCILRAGATVGEAIVGRDAKA